MCQLLKYVCMPSYVFLCVYMEICVLVGIYEQMCMLVRMTPGYLEEAFRKESRNEVELGTEEMRYFV